MKPVEKKIILLYGGIITAESIVCKCFTGFIKKAELYILAGGGKRDRVKVPSETYFDLVNR